MRCYRPCWIGRSRESCETMTKITDALLIKIAHAMDGPWNRSRFTDLLVELGLYKISDFQQGGIIRNYNFILEILQMHANPNFLREINERNRFPKEILKELLEVGIDLSKADDTEEASEPQKPIAPNSKTKIETQVKKEATPVKGTTKDRKENMSEEHPEVKAAIISSKSGVWIAIIGLIGGLLIAILTPFATKWANQPEPTPNPSSLAIEKIPYSVSTYEGEQDTDKLCCAGRAEWEYSNSVTFSPEYLLYYTLSDDISKYSYAGIAFVFVQSQNLSDYQNVELTVNFGTTINQVELNIEDIAQIKQPYTIVGNTNTETKFVVPLINFNKVDFKAIRAISFQVDSNFLSGSDKFVVKDIRFTK
jgi:hypothetical protein